VLRSRVGRERVRQPQPDHHRLQQVVEIVRDAAAQPSERLELLALQQRSTRLLGVAQRVGHPLLERAVRIPDPPVGPLELLAHQVRLGESGHGRLERAAFAEIACGRRQRSDRPFDAAADPQRRQRAETEQHQREGADEVGAAQRRGGEVLARHRDDERPARSGGLAEERHDGRAVERDAVEEPLRALPERREHRVRGGLAHPSVGIVLARDDDALAVDDRRTPVLRQILARQHRLHLAGERAERQVVADLAVPHDRHLDREAVLPADRREVQVRHDRFGLAVPAPQLSEHVARGQRPAERPSRIDDLLMRPIRQHDHRFPGRGDAPCVLVERRQVTARERRRLRERPDQRHAPLDLPVDDDRERTRGLPHALLERLPVLAVHREHAPPRDRRSRDADGEDEEDETLADRHRTDSAGWAAGL
jgi:hypothetical protein